MDASKILTDDMTLKEKLKAIQDAIDKIEIENIKRKEQGLAPIDPQDALQCDGCQ